MCGIAGRINFTNSNLIDVAQLKAMTDSIVHRGPDDEGHYVNENVGLGFRRLSIIDLHTGHQPLSNHEQNVWITFNGEVYNYKSLRSDLENKGYTFKTATDTEVILVAYLEYGERCVDHLRGMFAFVIWDDRKKQLYGARDHFGIKPFYYYIDNESFLWGSEIKAISAATDIPLDISLKALDCYFTYGYILKDLSVFQQIKKLEPAHYFVLRPYEDNKLVIKKYWEVTFAPDHSKSEEYWIEALREMLFESVRLQLVSDVPLGAFLSGGMDSGSVVAMMSRASDRPVKTFSIGFENQEFNELDKARLVAEKFRTEHNEMIVQPESISLLSKLVNAYDEPFADSSAIPTYYVSKFARENVTVALSGDGGDELFAGYDHYPKMLRFRENSILSSPLARKIGLITHKLLPTYFTGKGFTYYLSKNSDLLPVYVSLWAGYERRRLFNDDLLEQFNNQPTEETAARRFSEYKGDFLSRNQRWDMEAFMVDDVLTKVDRASMQNSLEVRVPVLDHKLAELSFSVPSTLKLNGTSKKYILKKAMEGILPDEIISGRKQGFALPFEAWFKNDLKEYIYDSINSSSAIRDYINIDYFRKTFENHQKGMRDFSGKLWSLLFFNEWLNSYRQSHRPVTKSSSAMV